MNSGRHWECGVEECVHQHLTQGMGEWAYLFNINAVGASCCVYAHREVRGAKCSHGYLPAAVKGEKRRSGGERRILAYQAAPETPAAVRSPPTPQRQQCKSFSSSCSYPRPLNSFTGPPWPGATQTSIARGYIAVVCWLPHCNALSPSSIRHPRRDGGSGQRAIVHRL